MANVLKMMKVEAIHSMRTAGLSCRAIARRLGINRDTVSRHLRLGRELISKPASAPISSAGSEGPVAGLGAPIGAEVAEVLGSERPLDCLTHHCHILEAKGESFRLQGNGGPPGCPVPPILGETGYPD